MKSLNAMIRPVAACLLAVGVALAPCSTPAQEKAAAADEWRAIESSAAMLTYKGQLRDGGFDDAAKTFLTETALPQLGLPKNRISIDRIRRRMRESLCGETGAEAKAAAAATEVVGGFMLQVARDPKNRDLVHRVNAMLMVGELRGPGGKPWPPAVPGLVAAVGDDALPAAVRIAAAAGLARHVEADPAARGADVGPALVKLVAAPLEGVDPLAADWLRSRALTMLGRMGAAAPAGAAAAAAGVLRDASRSIDLRVRAAAATGTCIKAAGDTDVAAAVAAIRDLALAALGDTKSRADRRELAARLAGMPVGQPGPTPEFGSGGEIIDTSDGDREIYRRDAWRLATLADALAPADGGGLAAVAGASQQEVTALAESLRAPAKLLDADPCLASLDEALAALAGGDEAGTDAAGEPAGEADRPADGEPAAGVEGLPFGNR